MIYNRRPNLSFEVIMQAGLDFGTSNSAVGVGCAADAQLVRLENQQFFLPSTLFTYDRNYVCDYINQNIPSSQKVKYQEQRHVQLRHARVQKLAEGFEPADRTVFFGNAAFEYYIDTPEEGTFVKSPKSFLGATGLSEKQVHFFEDLVTAKMLNIKQLAEYQLKEDLTKVVIGRPVNFQGVDSTESNQQAINIMTRAATRCGYQQIEFLYEPLAAGIDFETNLKKDALVLVVDIGGGTTDCSMVKMGPSFILQEDRSKDFIAHSGQRVGGNDLDIALTFHQLMPLFGKESERNNGLPIPSAPYWSAAAINHVAEQTLFYSDQIADSMARLEREACQPELIRRFIHLQQNKLNQRLVNSAEEAKIALSNEQEYLLSLSYIESDLNQIITQTQLKISVEKQLKNILSLVDDCLKQASTNPNFIYITGGSAKSPLIRKTLAERLPQIKIVDGDYFGSVAAGLTKWANKIWQ